MSYLFAVKCPHCEKELKVEIDTSTGVPSEAGVECDCGGIPIFYVHREPHIWLGEFKEWEASPREGPAGFDQWLAEQDRRHGL